MNVRVQRTVEFDRVIDYVANDTDAIKNDVANLLGSLNDLKEMLNIGMDISENLERIDSIRRALTHIDLRMQDCQEILVSYQRTKAQLDAEKYSESKENNNVEEEPIE